MSGTHTEPSPTADATRFTLPDLTSPTAKMPGLLVSSRSGRRTSGHPAFWRSSGRRSVPVLTKFLSSSARHPLSQAVFGSAPVHQEQVTDRARLRFPGVELAPSDPLEAVGALERVDLRARAQHHVRAVVDSPDQVPSDSLLR